MTTVALKKSTDSYWELIKDADSGVKIELIMRLTDALKPLANITQAAKTVSATKKTKKKTSAIDLPIVTDEDFKLSSDTLAMVADIEPMDETVDYDGIKLQYLKEKHQL